MDSSWQSAIDWIEDIKASGDDRVADWFLIRSPVPIVSIMVTYFTLVIYGPRWMKDRKPFQLKWLLIVYNGFQVALSSYMFYEFLVSAYLSGYNLTCQPLDSSMDPLSLRMADVSWWYFFSKIIDLADTAFFILRKKNNQMTFLHCYHHGTMVFNWWLGAKYAPGGQCIGMELINIRKMVLVGSGSGYLCSVFIYSYVTTFFCALLNSFVHIAMYSYYLLSALGPRIQRYLWWKRYLTQLQLVQFLLIVIHASVGLYNKCDFSPILQYFVSTYCMSLMVLFGNFYIKSYLQKRKRRRESDQDNHAKSL